jgi:hypothetical protein
VNTLNSDLKKRVPLLIACAVIIAVELLGSRGVLAQWADDPGIAHVITPPTTPSAPPR